MKRALLLPALLAAPFFCAAAFAAPPPADLAGGPRPGTVEAAQCLVRQGPPGCQTMFVGHASAVAQPWVWQNNKRDFNRGPLVWSRYWGRASQGNVFDAKVLANQPTNEMDIFDVKFAHVEYTFYISPADANGKINGLAIRLYPPHDPLQIRGGR